MRAAAGAHRPVGDAEADRGGRALPGRRRRGRRRRAPTARSSTSATRAARPRARAAADAARSGDVQRRVGAGLRPRRRAGPRAPDDAGLRQHAAHGRARRAPPRRAARQGSGRRAPRQPRARSAPRRRAAPEARRAEGAGRDRVARARHRHRRRRSRLPARLAALDRDLPAARRPLGPRGRRRAEGAPLPAVARRAGRMRGAARLPCGAASSMRCASSPAPLDVLAQQIVAETACREWDEDALFALVRRAWPYARPRRATTSTRSCACSPKASRRAAARARATCIATRSTTPARAPGRAADRAHLGRRDSRHRRLRGRARAAGARRSARSTRTSRSRASPATSSSSATRATASCASSPAACASRTRTARRRPSRSGSAKRRGAPTSCRSAVSRLRDEVGATASRATAATAAIAALRRDDRPRRRGGAPDRRLPRARRTPRSARCRRSSAIVIERFFDESGGMQLVIHAPFGSRINRAWGLALRKRFCRTLQLRAAGRGDRGRDRAVALDQPQLPARRGLALPAFGDRARRAGPGAARRADVRRALALERDHRARAAALRRRQEGRAAAAAHEVGGPARGGLPGPGRVRREPRRRRARFPTTRWSRRRCTTASTTRWTSTGWLRCCAASSRARSRCVARDLPAPSPLAAEVLSARPYAFLDDAPLEERRTQAVQNRRYADPDSADDLGQLDPDAIDERARGGLAGARATPTRCTRR